jgi:hypothetical protein
VFEHEMETCPYSKPPIFVMLSNTMLLEYVLVADAIAPMELRKMQALMGCDIMSPGGKLR